MGVGYPIAQTGSARKWGARDEILLGVLEGDLFAVTEWLDRAERFIFVDAVADEQSGRNVVLRECKTGLAASVASVRYWGRHVNSARSENGWTPFPCWKFGGLPFIYRRELGAGAKRAGAAGGPIARLGFGQVLGRVIERCS